MNILDLGLTAVVRYIEVSIALFLFRNMITFDKVSIWTVAAGCVGVMIAIEVILLGPGLRIVKDNMKNTSKKPIK